MVLQNKILLKITLLLIGGVALFFVYSIFVFELIPVGYYGGNSEKFCSRFTEEEYLGEKKVDIRGREGNMAIQNCYYDFFQPQNCNWLELRSLMEKQSLFTSHIGRKDFKGDAKRLASTGFQPCQLSNEKEFMYVPENEEFLLEDGNIAIDNYVLVDDVRLLKVDGKLYSGISREVKKPIEKADGSKSYEWINDKYTLILAEIDNGNPQILQKYNFNITETLDGPYHLQISRTKWIIFSIDLKLCKFISLEKSSGTYKFAEKPCQFDGEGRIVWEI